MKFQDSSFNGLKVTVGTTSVTHPRTHPPTHAPKAICPINFFKVGGIITYKKYVDITIVHCVEILDLPFADNNEVSAIYFIQIHSPGTKL